MNRRQVGRTALGVGAGLGCVGLLGSLSGPAQARETLSGQCGVENLSASYSIGTDGNLSMTLTGSGKGRTARFRFYGGDNGSNYSWTAYRYRYAVTANNFGPQSNEVIRFGRQRDDPGDAYWSEYHSPDNHNSNTGRTPPTQTMSARQTPGGDTEIWTKAIFDVPSVSDPSCWTNAIATK